MSRDTFLLITTSYPQASDGSEAAGAFVADLAETLSTHVPVRVVAPGVRIGSDDANPSLQVSRFASPGRPLSLLSPKQVGDWPAIVRTLRSLRSRALAADGDGRVAHCLALWTLPSGWAAAALHRSHGVPYSVWALGSDIWTLGKMPLVRTLLRRVIQGASGRYADGLQLAADAARIGGPGFEFEFLPSTRRITAPTAREPATQPPYRLLFLGRWHPNKGIDLLLEALGLLDEAAWARIAQVTIAGGGPMEALVREGVAGLQAAGRPLRLHGFMDEAQAGAAISEADWLLIPSRVESIPVVFSDAIKLGRPVISTPVGDLAGLIEGEYRCGVVSTGATAPAFATAIADAVHGSPHVFAEGVAHTARRFDIDTIAKRLLVDAGMEQAMERQA